MRESIDDVLECSEVVVVGNAAAEFSQLAQKLRPEQTLIDLVRLGGKFNKDNYVGICW